MSKPIHAFTVVVMLLAISAPVSAQAEIEVCLRVQATADVDLTDVSAVHEGIGSGEIVITEVVPCDAPVAQEASPSGMTDIGAWKVLFDETDAVTRERRVTVELGADSGVTNLGIPNQLSVRCSDGWVSATIGWGWDLGPEPHIDVEMQIGDGEVITEPWFNLGGVTDYGRVDTAFIESLFGESRLAVAVTTPDGDRLTALFNITGIEDAVAGVREACDW